VHVKPQLLALSIAAAHREEPTHYAEDLALMRAAMEMRVVERLTPDERFRWLADGLMSPYPSHFLRALRSCGALALLLPEVDRLFGVPLLSDAATPVDVGLHQLALLDVTADIHAPLEVRAAALFHKIGMGETPREIWPSHYKHEQRGVMMLSEIDARISMPASVLSLARLTIEEADRVHRASDMRAGAITTLLERVGAPENPRRFEQLLSVCTCDFAAYAGHRAADYPKAPRLRRALRAYLDTPVDGMGPDALADARAQSVARALGSSQGSLRAPATAQPASAHPA
jgi:tRNA nucleotidyltransferase (CCA-adding enzyme)